MKVNKTNLLQAIEEEKKCKAKCPGSIYHNQIKNRIKDLRAKMEDNMIINQIKKW